MASALTLLEKKRAAQEISIGAGDSEKYMCFGIYLDNHVSAQSEVKEDLEGNNSRANSLQTVQHLPEL